MQRGRDHPCLHSGGAEHKMLAEKILSALIIRGLVTQHARSSWQTSRGKAGSHHSHTMHLYWTLKETFSCLSELQGSVSLGCHCGTRVLVLPVGAWSCSAAPSAPITFPEQPYKVHTNCMGSGAAFSSRGACRSLGHNYTFYKLGTLPIAQQDVVTALTTQSSSQDLGMHLG